MISSFKFPVEFLGFQRKSFIGFGSLNQVYDCLRKKIASPLIDPLRINIAAWSYFIKYPDNFILRPNVLVHNIWLPDIQDSATFNKISTLQQDKVNGTTSEESTQYPVIEEEMPNKQQKVSRGNPNVNVEHNNSCKRAKKKTKTKQNKKNNNSKSE